MSINSKRPFYFSSLILLLVSLLGIDLQAQKRPVRYFDGAYQVYSLKYKGMHFKAFDFDMSSRSIRTAYFGQQGKKQFEAWQRRNRKKVLCYLAVGFAQDFDQAQPLGLCIDRGHILNRSLESRMDGLVSISPQGMLSALDLDRETVAGRFDLRKLQHKASFLNTYSRQRYSCFQTQLMYSALDGSKMGEPKHGNRAARRFLAVCKDAEGKLHHIVMDLIESVHLNRAAQHALIALEARQLEVLYLLNQDTGARNIMRAFDQSGKIIYAAPVDLSQATQLLVYYRDR